MFKIMCRMMSLQETVKKILEIKYRNFLNIF